MSNCGVDTLPENLEKLGTYKAGQGCVNVNKLDGIDRSVLKGLIVETEKNAKSIRKLNCHHKLFRL